MRLCFLCGRPEKNCGELRTVTVDDQPELVGRACVGGIHLSERIRGKRALLAIKEPRS